MEDILLKIFCLTFLSLQSVTSDLFHLRLELSTDSANVGETLKAVCRVNKTPSSSSPASSSSSRKHYQIIWFKILPESNGEEVEIATNAFLNDEFNATKRFQAGLQIYNPENINQVDFFLHIFNVQVEDSGYLGCKIGLPGLNTERFKLFVVNVPVYNVWWSSLPSNTRVGPTVFSPGENLTFFETGHCHFVCNVNGSYPRPHVKIFVGSEDLTQYFASSSVLVRSPGVRGLQAAYYLVQMSNRSLAIEYRFNDKELKCIASIVHPSDTAWENQIKSTSIFIRVTEYRPKFFCSRRVLVNMRQVNFTFSCIVRARPEVTHVNFTKLSTNLLRNFTNLTSIQMSSADDPTNEDPQTFVKIKELNSMETLVVMTMERVTHKQLGTYVLEASNEVGSEQHEIELHPPENFQRLTSSSHVTSLCQGCHCRLFVRSSLFVTYFVIILCFVFC